MAERVRLGIVGCGNIAGPYARALADCAEAELVAVADLDPARAEALAAEGGCRAYPDLPAMLRDSSIELVVNLAIHHAHYALTKLCLEAGKHVYSEKPLAMSVAEAQELVQIADARGLRLGCSPFTFLGAAQQAAWEAIREGRLGKVRLAYAEVNWGRIESWHPAPEPFYEVGALFDVGVYPLTILTAIFGPAKQVTAYGRVLHPDRRTKHGAPFAVATPDFVTALIELEQDVLVRLTTNFYVDQKTRQSGIEFHGDDGSLHLASWQNPDSELAIAPLGKPYEPLASFAGARMSWGQGVREMAQALRADRPHRSTGEQAAHVVEILAAAATSVRDGGTIPITSNFSPPAPGGYA